MAAAPSSTANPALPPGAPPDREWDPFWFRLVAAATLYRLGRLEFAPMRWPHPFRWFRHRTSGRTVLVAGDGVRFTADGYLTGDTTWTSACQGERGVVIAHPVRPTGTAERRQVRLPTGEWDQVLGPGDPVLDLHVPEDGGRLTLDVLRDALTRAERFFADFHPEHPFVAFFCASWLFGPFLPGLIGEDSGIVRWQREGYLSPDTGRAEGVLRWVFGSRSADPATAPGDTRLRAGVLRLLQDGAPLRQGRWLLARDDLHRFGTQPYRDSDRVIDDLLGPP